MASRISLLWRALVRLGPHMIPAFRITARARRAWLKAEKEAASAHRRYTPPSSAGSWISRAPSSRRRPRPRWCGW